MNLFIDTHLNDIVLILFKGNKIYLEKIIKDERQNSKYLMPNIAVILKDVKLNSIVVCNGPGSFTGVRLAVTVAKTLAYTLNIPIRTITSLECMAISLSNKDKIVGFSDNNGYYIGIFNEDLNLIGDYEYLSNSEFLEYTQKYSVNTDVELNYSKIFEYVMKKEVKIAHDVNPVYIKKIDVEK